jgi:hypothetical protein
MKQLLKGFKDGLSGLDRNALCDAIADKNSIICQLIIDQVADNKRFEIPEKLYGDKTCPKCSGLGLKILFERELSVRTCLKCDHGKKEIPCTKCQNGRFIREKGDLKINVECKFCHGTKTREVKCHTCRGTGELRKMVITPKIKSTTPCKHCHELGFIDDELMAILSDTAKFSDAADQLLECIIPVESPVDELNAPLAENVSDTSQAMGE